MHDAWKNRKVWLAALPQPVPADLKTPLEVAAFEAESFFASRGIEAQLSVQPDLGEGYFIQSTDSGYLVSGGETGILYGVYALLRAFQSEESLPSGLQQPFYALRMLDCWDNMDGSIERGYAGRSLWFDGNVFAYDPARIRQLGRMLASVGINVLCINNVNVHAPAANLIDSLLPEVAALAAVFRPFGVRLMLSIDFSMPLRSGLTTADPEDPGVARWWQQQARKVWAAVPDLAGFLVKADSEHRPGPAAYHRTHAQGANMIARAIAPFGGVLVWRAFVYDCLQDWRDTQTDRPRAACDFYLPQDGHFDDHVILQIKYGPFDFQVREPLSPLLLRMQKTRLALEFQLAQEYTGHQIDLFAMPPMWREILDQLDARRVQAIAAVSNLGNDENWTGHPMAALNLFAFGLFAWNPEADPAQVISCWIRNTYSLPAEERHLLGKLLLSSRSVYEQYTAPLGLCWMVQPESHYGPSPYGYEFQAWGTYNRADRDAVGIDRTETGTCYTGQYPMELARLYSDPKTCPEKLLLFFHRLSYDYVLRDGRTMIQRIYDDHFEGADEAEKMRDTLSALSLPEPDRSEVLARADQQVRNAREWRDVINTFFHRLSGFPDAHGRKIYD